MCGEARNYRRVTRLQQSIPKSCQLGGCRQKSGYLRRGWSVSGGANKGRDAGQRHARTTGLKLAMSAMFTI
jgi:hypothetical protein